jgi:hypothetical protein
VIAFARSVRLVTIVGLLAALSGCTQPGNVEEQVSTLKPLAILYGRYLGMHAGQPPANESEFRAFVEKEASGLLEQFSVKNPSDLFVSTRDQQPYVILYGPLTGPPGPAGQPVFAYEKVGVGGKRMVASSLGAVAEVDETEFKRLVPAAL